MSRLTWTVTIMLLIGGWVFPRDFSFKVRHDHNPWGECIGEMTVSESGIKFESEDEEHSFDRDWTGIQSLDRKTAMEFTILSYEDRKWLAGRDRALGFTVVEGDGLQDEVFNLILQNFPGPVVDRVVSNIDDILYEISVKHLHTFGGCEGLLQFGPEKIVFDSHNEEDSRSWRIDTEITGVWSSGAYDLDITVREGRGLDSGSDRRFRFQLKRPIDEDFMFRLRRQILP